jgi:hypothetical protein
VATKVFGACAAASALTMASSISSTETKRRAAQSRLPWPLAESVGTPLQRAETLDPASPFGEKPRLGAIDRARSHERCSQGVTSASRLDLLLCTSPEPQQFLPGEILNQPLKVKFRSPHVCFVYDANQQLDAQLIKQR